MALTRASAAVIKTEELVGFRNKIINGAMEIDQRNSGSSVSVDGANVYGVDRWTSTEIGDGAFTQQRSTDAPAGFKNSLLITTTTAQTETLNAVTRQYIEGQNIIDLAWGTASAKTVTLSFWVKSSLTGTFGGSLKNSDNTRNYAFSYTIDSANTWQYETITIPGDTAGTWLTTTDTGITVWFSHGATNNLGTGGSWTATDVRGVTGQTNIISTLNATWQITGVQLEVGSAATPFERRPFGMELALCQRYYQKILNGSGGAASTSSVETFIQLPVNMRAGPSVSAPDGVLQVEDHSVTLYSQSSASVSIIYAKPEGGKIVLINFTGLTSARYYSIAGAVNNRAIHFSSEL
jgi:hypothetical protein